MLCSDAETRPLTELEHSCYACSIKIRTVDMPNANTYAFTEVTVQLMSYTTGFRADEDYSERYYHVIASHGFNPDEINQIVFQEPERK